MGWPLQASRERPATFLVSFDTVQQDTYMPHSYLQDAKRLFGIEQRRRSSPQHHLPVVEEERVWMLVVHVRLLSPSLWSLRIRLGCSVLAIYVVEGQWRKVE